MNCFSKALARLSTYRIAFPREVILFFQLSLGGCVLLQDIEKERRRRENPEAMEEDSEDEVSEIKAAHFEESMKFAWRSVSDADIGKYRAFARTTAAIHEGLAPSSASPRTLLEVVVVVGQIH
ncbi:hypothetical protein Dimus_014037 [Dionaea muscipula]